MGRGIFIELQHWEGAHTMRGLLDGLAGGGVAVILAVERINCLRPPFAHFFSSTLHLQTSSVFTEPMGRLEAVTAHMEDS